MLQQVRRFGVVFALGAVGLVLCAVAALTSGYLQALLLQFGGAFVLLSPLVLLERHVVRRLETSIEDAVAAAGNAPSVESLSESAASVASQLVQAGEDLGVQLRVVRDDDPLVSFWASGHGRLGAVALHPILDVQSVTDIRSEGADVVLALGKVTTAALGNPGLRIVRLGSDAEAAARSFVAALGAADASAAE